MGNEISTIGGGAATVGAAVLAGVTFGQVEDFNNAVVDSAKYTARHAEKTVVRHVGETVAMAVATAGTSIASGVTFGQIKELNDAVVHCAKHTAEASERAGAELLVVADGLTDSIPVVGHVKGGICYAAGNHERGERAMKSSSRTVGVIGGGVGGFFVGGPIGAVAGGVAGGAAMDGIITGAEFVIHDEFKPHGQIASWDQVVKAKNNDERIGGIVGGVMTPIVDALTGYGAGKTFDVIRQRVSAANNPPTLLQKIEAKLNMDSTVTNNAAIHPGSSSGKLKGGGHHSGAAAGGGGGGDIVKPVAGGVGVVTFANNIETMFQKFKNGDVKQAVDDALDHVVSLAQGPTPEQQVAINGLGETADAVGSGTNGETKQKAKRALQHMWNQVVQQFKEGLAEKNNSGEPAIAELNHGTANEQVRSSLVQSATPSGQGADECDGLVMQAMGALGGIVGGKAAEALHDVAKSDKTKEVLQRMWDQISKRLTDNFTQRISGEATAADTPTSESENTQSLVVRPPSDDNRAPNSSNKELFFVLIVIYAALSALMMTASQK